MTYRQTITTLLAICALGAAMVVFAQDDDENPVVDANDVIDDVVNDVTDVNNNDIDADAGVVDAANEPEKAPKAPKSGGKPSKSKSKSGKSDESVSIAETAAAEKASAKKAADEGTTLKYNGLVAAGVDFNSKENKRSAGKKAEAMVSKRVAKGELELSAQPVKKVRAEMGIEYNINGITTIDAIDSLRLEYPNKPIGDPQDSDAEIYKPVKGVENIRKVWLVGPFVAVDKLYAQYNIIDNGAVRVGIMKKFFGLEERAGLDERYFLKRSIINEGLEELGFLDHDLTAAYRHDLLSGALRLTGAFSWSAVDSLAYLQNYSAHYRPAPNTELILAGIVRHYSANDTLKLPVAPRDTSIRLPTLLTAFAASLSFRHDAARFVSEAEVTVGTNPHILLTQNRTALLFGARLQEQFPIDVNTKILRRVVPVVEAALYTADVDSGHTDTQIKAGVTLGFAKNSAFQFRNNIGTIIRTANGVSAVRRYRFDSEVVVVF